MLAANRQAFDANLRSELQTLRIAELQLIVTRFENLQAPAVMIAGFAFLGICELEFLPLTDMQLNQSEIPFVQEAQRRAEPVFYLASASALALALFVTIVCALAMTFGQRLQMQSTAQQGSQHDSCIAELNGKFVQCLISLGASMAGTVIAAVAAVWVKQAYDANGTHRTAIAASGVVAVCSAWTMISLLQMFCRLHTWKPANARLSLYGRRDGRGRSAAPIEGLVADEFYVHGGASNR